MRDKKSTKTRNISTILIELLLFTTILLWSCSDKDRINEVKTDTYFSDLFYRTGEGFNGGDGTYSVELPGGRNIWIFGDTFLGNIRSDGTREKTDPLYVRNSFVIQDGDNLTTIWQKINGRDHSAVIPPHVLESGFEIPETKTWYWPGDGFIENGELKIFLSEFHQVDTGMWGFAYKGTALATFILPSLTLSGIQYFDYPNTAEIHFGHAVMEEEAYTYIYGLGNGRPYVARAVVGNIGSPWEFYTRDGWSRNSEEALAMMDIEGSEQFTIFKWNGKYVLITQLGGLSDLICSFTSDDPATGWGNRQVLYKTPLPEGNKNLFTYNAVAHPQFVKDNMLLISYNTNSFMLEDHFKDAGIYRPRFIRVPFQLIHPDFR